VVAADIQQQISVEMGWPAKDSAGVLVFLRALKVRAVGAVPVPSGTTQQAQLRGARVVRALLLLLQVLR
jgi:hypothetical protein